MSAILHGGTIHDFHRRSETRRSSKLTRCPTAPVHCKCRQIEASSTDMGVKHAKLLLERISTGCSAASRGSRPRPIGRPSQLSRFGARPKAVPIEFFLGSRQSPSGKTKRKGGVRVDFFSGKTGFYFFDRSRELRRSFGAVTGTGFPAGRISANDGIFRRTPSPFLCTSNRKA